MKVGSVNVLRTEPRSIPDMQPWAGLISTARDSITADNLIASAAKQLEEAQAKAVALMEQAEIEARRILETASAEAIQLSEQVRKQGYEDGYAAGFDQALSQAEAESQALIQSAQSIVQAADVHRLDLIGGLAEPLTFAVMSSVRSLLNRELTTSGPDIYEMIASLLAQVMDSTRVEVRVHPDDYPAAMLAHPRWQSQKYGDWSIVVVPDMAVSPGGCEIRSDVGRVDARIETKLELLQAAMSDFMERRVNEFVDAMV